MKIKTFFFVVENNTLKGVDTEKNIENNHNNCQNCEISEKVKSKK